MYLQFIYEISLGVIIILAFAGSINYRVKTILIRHQLKGEKLIIGRNILLKSLLNIAFWMIPLKTDHSIEFQYVNKLAKRSNFLLLLFTIISLFLLLSQKVLW